MNLKDKKITVLGIGGVGGYLGALLAEHYEHVSFVARGKRGESIRENGLVLSQCCLSFRNKSGE